MLSNKQKGFSLDIFPVSTETVLELPLVSENISAGFPSPALDFQGNTIDLNKILIKNSVSTFFGKVKGFSMEDVGISDGDLLIIDKGLAPKDGKIAICYVDGEFTVKTIKKDAAAIWLMPANSAYEPIKVTEENDFLIWGIVTHVIKSF